MFGRRLVLEWAQPEQTQDVEILRLKEEQLAGISYFCIISWLKNLNFTYSFTIYLGPSSKRLKKSKIIEDLGGGDEFNKMDVTDN